MPDFNTPATVIVAFLVLLGTVYTARNTFRAMKVKTKSDELVGSGQLALEMAKENRTELKDFKLEQAAKDATNAARWSAVREAWGLHDEWDAHVLEELEKLEPGAGRRLGRRPLLPLD